MLSESVLTAVTVTGLSVYGVAFLFIKAWLILILANTLADQFEFSPAAIRHSIWMIALISIGLLPVLPRLLPGLPLLTVEVSSSVADATSTATSEWINAPLAASRLGFSSLSWIDWFSVAYLLVAIIGCVRLLKDLLFVAWVTVHATQAPGRWYQLARDYSDRKIVIRISPTLEGPVTWGNLRPVILLPGCCELWSAAEKSMVIQHELAHIERWDWLLQLIARSVTVLFWPVVGIHHAFRQLSLEAERACDDRVLTDGVNAADYAGLLLAQARKNQLQATVALGQHSELAQRVRHIVNVYVDRAGITRAKYFLFTVAAVFLVPFAVVQAKVSHQNATPLAGFSVVSLTEQDKPTGAQTLLVQEWMKWVDDEHTARPNKPIVVTEPAAKIIVDSPAIDGLTPELDSFMPPSETGEVIEIPPISYARAQLIQMRKPQYPLRAQKRGIEGRVVVQFDLDKQGLVINPQIIERSSGYLFDRSVLEAIKGYRYSPHRVDGVPVRLQGMQEEFLFRLTDAPETKRAAAGDRRAGQSIHSG